MSQVKPTKASESYDQLKHRVSEANLLASTTAILEWDQETMMPNQGVDHRSAQLEQLARMTHNLCVDPQIGELLSVCEEDPDLLDQPGVEANVREMRRDYDRETKLPATLVAELAKTSSLSLHAWQEARARSSFREFQPWLEKLVGLLTQKADCLGYPKDGERWDALADEYEPSMKARDIDAIFTPLRTRLRVLIDEILGAPSPPTNRFNETMLPLESQKNFVRFVAEQIGFDFTAGRLDTSTHPFCGGSHCRDVRMTTRFHENNVNDALGSTMHEAGHGIYEQGLLYENAGIPLGQAVSLGIHESQSRLWENQVGRSIDFWKWGHPKLKDFFGEGTGHLTLEEIYGGANIVKPGFIRVEADEATYNLHIMVRFDVERLLLSGDLTINDLPDCWNEKYKDYLGLTVPDDRTGCLQDVHWGMGAMGYFPTYTLGNLYAAQLFETASSKIGNLPELFARGDFKPLKTWLNENIHQHGRKYLPAELCRLVTGKPLSPEPLMRHLEGKLRPIYGL